MLKLSISKEVDNAIKKRYIILASLLATAFVAYQYPLAFIEANIWDVIQILFFFFMTFVTCISLVAWIVFTALFTYRHITKR